MKNLKHIIILISITICLAGCQTTKLNTDKSAQISEPRIASSETDLNQKYLWGGEILSVENLKDTTELTIISYPLDTNEKPKYTKQSTGRFIASHLGFLSQLTLRRAS